MLDGLVCTPVGLLDRSFRQDRRMIADQVNGWLGALVSIGLAWAGLGAMSLAVGRIAGAVAGAVLYLAFSPEPLRFGFDRARARALLRYGMPLAGSTVVVFAVTNVDQLVVGHMLGATPARQVKVEVIEVVDHHIGGLADLKSSSVKESEEVGAHFAHLVMHLFKRHMLTIASDPCQEVGRPATATEELDVSSSVGHTGNHSRVAEQHSSLLGI